MSAPAENKWKPIRKVEAAAIATLLVFLLQGIWGVEVPVGVEGAFAVLVAYLVPGRSAQVGGLSVVHDEGDPEGDPHDIPLV